MHNNIENITIIRESTPPRFSRRVHDVCWQFGVPPRESPQIIASNIAISLAPGSITLLTGPSGSGKSSLLSEIARRIANPVWVRSADQASNHVGPASSFAGPASRRSSPITLAVVDRVGPNHPLPAALEILTACGLGEPRLWVRREADLSDGEKFRAALARAVGRALAADAHPPIFCDEFSAILHRRLARCIAFNLRKLVSRHKLALVLATTHDDVAADLQPDTHIRLGHAGPQTETRPPSDRPVSLRQAAIVEPGALSDYRYFAPMHYRHRDALGFVDKVFLLRDRADRQPLGIAVYAHASPELTLRNHATQGRFTRNLVRLNRELRILRRLVMHPDVRGCGLGHWFVRETLPRVGTRFVECLAAMGAVNPVFERAGMTRIGRCPAPRGRIALLERISKWDLDPFSDCFAHRIRRCPRVRKLVLSTIHDWLAATHGGADPTHKSPDDLAVIFRQLLADSPMYYLWDREGEFPAKPESNPRDPVEHAPRRPSPRSNPDARHPIHGPPRPADPRHHPDRKPD